MQLSDLDCYHLFITSVRYKISAVLESKKAGNLNCQLTVRFQNGASLLLKPNIG
jgi:hypothetical protein